MKVVVDTNVILDALLDREPHDRAAVRLLQAVERGLLQGGLCATTVTTLEYLLTRATGVSKARALITDLLDLFEVARVDDAILRRALTRQGRDFEDSVLAEAARHWGAEAIVTRDHAGFASSKITLYSPAELVSLLPHGPGAP